jgi:divalent metal cation (Fe/Co/Zn/Cd) transporter
VSHDDGNAGWRPQVPGGNQLDAAARGESAGEPVSGGQAGMGSDSRTAVIASIAANVAIALTKFVVAIVSRSAAMFAEAIHSLVNCFDGTLLLLGAWRAKRPPDELHPFGHGRELYFWNLIVAIIFFALGSGFTIYEGVRRTLAPEPLGAARWSYIVLAASALFSVVLEDTADLIGLSVAALGVFLSHALGDARIDGIASIAIGLVLGAVATVLLIETHGLLIGESAAPELIEAVRAAAAGDSDVAHVEEMLTVQLGPSDVVVALRVVLRADLQAHEVTAATSRIEDRIRHEHGDVKRVFVELSAAERDGARQARGT